MPDPILTILQRHDVERKALLARFELELRNPTIPVFVRPNTEDRLALHGGCSVLTGTPFTVLFVDSVGRPCANMERRPDGRVGMNFLGTKPQVFAVSPEGAKRLHAWGHAHLVERKSDMRCEVWSCDAAELYFRLHEAQIAEIMPLLEDEKADGRAVEVTP